VPPPTGVFIVVVVVVVVVVVREAPHECRDLACCGPLCPFGSRRPVSPLTHLCPPSSAPFFIAKGLYLGQVFSQVSAVVSVFGSNLLDRKRGDHTDSSTPSAFRHSGRTLRATASRPPGHSFIHHHITSNITASSWRPPPEGWMISPASYLVYREVRSNRDHSAIRQSPTSSGPC
jgi:hypothetical protein